MSRAVISYVVGFILLGVFATIFAIVAYPVPDPLLVLLCAVMFLVGELVTFETPSGKGNVSMAAMMHLAMVPVFPAATLALAVWGSRLPAELIVQRRIWYRAVFNAAQISLALAAAAALFDLLGHEAPATLSRETMPGLLPALFAATAAYYLINHGAVVGVITLLTGSTFWAMARENYGSRAQIATSGAVFVIAPIATIIHQTLGVWGLAVFTLPMLLLRDACRRYFALERAQQALISSERLAAKGEMAASVAHELNNYLAVLSGNLQIVQIQGQAMTPESHGAKINKSLEQVQNMATLAKGLMDFSNLDCRRQPTNLTALVEETVDFLKPQNRFDPVTVSIDCDPRIGRVTVDPGQIQQVLMNLLNNAADAMRDAACTDRNIWVTLGRRTAQNRIEITVADSGPGVPSELQGRIFAPGFTTKHDGHGFGLSTVYRIVQNHSGEMSVEKSAINGALFRILLPMEKPAEATPAVRTAA